MQEQPEIILTSKIIARISRLAGFNFTDDRCELLAPQLKVILNSVKNVENMAGTEEPFGFYTITSHLEEEELS